MPSEANAIPEELLAAIRQPILEYIEAWYAGDGERIGRCVHPDLAKRTVGTLPTGRAYLEPMSATMLAEVTRLGRGRETPPEQQVSEIHILDVDGDMASARVRSSQFSEYLHLARLNGAWVIVNVLWRWAA
jgi:hypothetical protein